MAQSMHLDLYDLDRDIELHGWKEVTTASYFLPNSSELHPNGLFSPEIFGEPGTIDRERNWGWVRLNDVFMNPHAFYVFNRLKKTIAQDMKTGTNRYYVDVHGEITKLAPGKTVPADAKYKVVGVGFDWLRDAWKHISWRITPDMTKTAKVRRKFLKSFPITAIFWDKFPIMPAFYRDVDYSSTKQNVINKNYTKLIHLANIVRTTDGILFTDDYDTPLKSISYSKLQDLMNEIAEFFFGKIGGADGFINNHVVGKATDYGARMVISTATYNFETADDIDTDFFHSSVPLAVAINIFAPFMIFNVKRWVTNHVSGNRFLTVYNDKTKTTEQAELAVSYADEFTSDGVRKLLDLYKKSKEFRVKPVTLKGANDTRIPVYISYRFDKSSDSMVVSTDLEPMVENENIEIIRRPITYCEWFYIIAHDCLDGKCVDISRYPMDDYYHMYPSLMNIVPATKYFKVIVNGRMYPRYPNVAVKSKEEIEHLFVDSLKMFGIYPASLGADFDGDQVSLQSLFSDEANEEAKKQMSSPTHIIGINGKFMREVPLIARHGLYNVTYMNDKP